MKTFTKEEVLKELNSWHMFRWSAFINGKRFTLKKALSYIKNNVSDDSIFDMKYTRRSLPWWLGDWGYNMHWHPYDYHNHRYFRGKNGEKITLLFCRVERSNLRITIKNKNYERCI